MDLGCPPYKPRFQGLCNVEDIARRWIRGYEALDEPIPDEGWRVGVVPGLQGSLPIGPIVVPFGGSYVEPFK